MAIRETCYLNKAPLNHRRGYPLGQNLCAFAREYQAKSPAIVGLNSNNSGEYPEGGPEKMVNAVKSAGHVVPYPYDETQAVAKSYRAACAPDFFHLDAARAE